LKFYKNRHLPIDPAMEGENPAANPLWPVSCWTALGGSGLSIRSVCVVLKVDQTSML
jgi:hypothetical protein